MTVDREELDHLVGFVRHALTHLERGNVGAVREALEDAEARLRALLARKDDGDGW
jgi:soluble cytochrome b562